MESLFHDADRIPPHNVAMSSPDADERVAALASELETLRSEVQRLRDEIEVARGRIGLTMRDQLRCPGCGTRQILHSSEICTSISEGSSISLQLRMVVTGQERPALERRPAGAFQVYVCSGCGLAEWYVPDRRDLQIDGLSLRLLAGDADARGPYR